MNDDSTNRAAVLFGESHGLMRTAEAIAAGVHPRTFYRLRDEAVSISQSRGNCRLAELPELADPDLIVVAARVSRASSASCRRWRSTS